MAKVGRRRKRRLRHIKRDFKKILAKYELSEDPFTAEIQVLERKAAPTYEVLFAIMRLKQFKLFEAFGHDERFFPGGKQ